MTRKLHEGLDRLLLEAGPEGLRITQCAEAIGEARKRVKDQLGLLVRWGHIIKVGGRYVHRSNRELPFREKVLRLVQLKNGMVTVGEIYDELVGERLMNGKPKHQDRYQTITAALSGHVKAGRLVRVERGVYDTPHEFAKSGSQDAPETSQEAAEQPTGVEDDSVPVSTPVVTSEDAPRRLVTPDPDVLRVMADERRSEASRLKDEADFMLLRVEELNDEADALDKAAAVLTKENER